MAADLGSDFSFLNDLDPNLSVISGRTCLAQALVRRLSTKRGGLWYDENYGTDLREFLNSSAGVNVIAQAAENECRKDERVADVEALVEYLADSQTIQVKLRIWDDTDSDSFVLTLAVGSLTVELLELSEAA